MDVNVVYGIVILLSVQILTHVHGDCGSLPVYENASNNATGTSPPYSPGTIFSVFCNEGYSRYGSPLIQCQNDDTWLPYGVNIPITCTPKSCGDPGTPLNGRFDSYQFTVGKSVRFSCDEGYELIGDETRLCLITAQWTGDTPTCQIVTCPSLPAPTNGALQGTDLTYGNTINLQCNEGFKSRGPTFAVCQGNKTWSNQPFLCEEIDCGPFGSVPNAIVEAQGGTTWGESVHVRCFDNATYQGDSQSGVHIIHCTDAGTWGRVPPQCLGCCDVTEGDNSTPYIRNRACVPHGSSLQSSLFTCNSGYYLSDPGNNHQCNNGSLLPSHQCIRITCDVQSIQNGRILGASVGDEVDYSTTLSVECDDGYSLVAPYSFRCVKNPTYPRCLPAGCTVPPGFVGNIRDANSKKSVKGSFVEHGTKLIFTCPEDFVISNQRDFSLSKAGECSTGVLTELPTCIETPCSMSSITDIGKGKVEDSCLILEKQYIKHGCQFFVMCEEEQKNATCNHGEVQYSCSQSSTQFPTWAAIVLGVVVAGLVGVAVFFGVKKVSSSNHSKPKSEHADEIVKLKSLSPETAAKGDNP